MQRWLDLSSRGFLFVFPKGADLPVTFTLVIIKSTGEMHSGASSSSSPTLRILTPASQGPLGVPLSCPPGSLPSLPWQALEQFPS